MNWQVFLDHGAEKSLHRFPKKDRQRIEEVLQTMKVNPYAGDIQMMKGEKDVWRRRIGSYRVQYEIRLTAKIIYIFDIKRRTSGTY